jgi:hypothetical protein
MRLMMTSSHRSDQSPSRGPMPKNTMQPVTCLLRKFPPGAYRAPDDKTFISSPSFSARFKCLTIREYPRGSPRRIRQSRPPADSDESSSPESVVQPGIINGRKLRLSARWLGVSDDQQIFCSSSHTIHSQLEALWIQRPEAFIENNEITLL